MKKRLLTLEDLYSYYSSQSTSIHFSSNTDNENIVVQVIGNIKFENSDKNTEGLTPVVLQSCHTLRNRNTSYISEETMSSALPSFSNRPILGYIHEVDGQPEFWGHNMHLDKNQNLVYDEICVGVIPESCDAKLEFDERKQKTYVVVKGYLFDEYTKASEILQREKECFVSVELSIRELSYNAQEKYLEIEDFFFSGVTILGKNDDGEIVLPGMDGSNIKIADFSQENNSLLMTKNNEVIEMLESISSKIDTLSNFTINKKSQEGGKQMSKFEELLNKYNKTAEEIDFNHSEMSEDELESKFAELFDENTNLGEDNTSTETVDSDNLASDNDNDDDLSTENETLSANYTKTFELSHDDIRSALYVLLSPYEESDDDWYWINDVYDDYFVYEGLKNNIYGQKYIKDDTNVSLEGERYSLHKVFLTDSEYTELEKMRSNYSQYKDKVEKYEKVELDKKKSEIFEKEAYAKYLETEEFKALQKDIDEYSVEELADKAEIAFAKCVQTLGFSLDDSNDTHKIEKKQFIGKFNQKKPSRYAGLFKASK